MSYRSLLKMTCTVLEATETQVGGMTSHSWNTVTGAESVRCFLDLNFIRAGKDPVWTPDTNMAQNRAGVLFLSPKINGIVVPGNRVKMIKGPPGTFLIASSLDEAWSNRRLHHLECFVTEIDRTLVGG